MQKGVFWGFLFLFRFDSVPAIRGVHYPLIPRRSSSTPTDSDVDTLSLWPLTLAADLSGDAAA